MMVLRISTPSSSFRWPRPWRPRCSSVAPTMCSTCSPTKLVPARCPEVLRCVPGYILSMSDLQKPLFIALPVSVLLRLCLFTRLHDNTNKTNDLSDQCDGDPAGSWGSAAGPEASGADHRTAHHGTLGTMQRFSCACAHVCALFCWCFAHAPIGEAQHCLATFQPLHLRARAAEEAGRGSAACGSLWSAG